MFTGLIKEIGVVKKITPNAEGAEITVSSVVLLSEIVVDDSIAINGVCQTATAVSGDSFTVQAVHISMEKTTLGRLRVGDEVNMELALRASDRLGGHIVQGHVNYIADLTGITSKGNNYLVSITLPADAIKYVVAEGSITIDGISLTVAYLAGNKITVSIIPHTFENTILKNKNVGDKINIEVDIIAKYVEQLLGSKKEEKTSSSMTENWLSSKGF
ncbi:MAG: riboflavin synthase [Bacteriovoracaceae bacterium]|nr:riboflavin synthase [Bacteriovoracaceae bacterium]